MVGLREDAVEVLLGLADVLVDDGREVDRVEVEPELAARRTSAASVLPVPDSPAKSAVMPRPRALPPRIAHSSRTRSR